MKFAKTLSVALFLASLCVPAAWAQQPDRIVHDAEYYILEALNGNRWAAEDKALDAKLAELRQKHGRPPNLIHVLLDNGQHESTGGQGTVTPMTDLGGVAAACGYPNVDRVNTPEHLARLLETVGEGLRFVHVPIRPGIAGKLPRPHLSPASVAARLRSHLSDPGAERPAKP